MAAQRRADGSEIRIARIEEQINQLQRSLESLAKLPGESIEHELMIESLGRHIERARKEAKDDLDGLKSFVHDELDDLKDVVKAQAVQRAEARTRIVLAVIAGSFLTLGSLITAIFTLMDRVP